MLLTEIAFAYKENMALTMIILRLNGIRVGRF